MSRIRVKICGITSLEDLHIAVEAGADAVGFIVDVPRSPRNLSMNEAKKFVKATPVFVKTVVVTVPKDLNHVKYIYRELSPNILQVHNIKNLGEEIRGRLPEACLIGAVQVQSDLTIEAAVEAANMFDAVLLDSYVQGKYGGTGRTHDWKLSQRVRERIHPKPMILAGGLNSENVREAIRTVKPYAVDVSSSVESGSRKKDREEVIEFIRKAKEVEV
jgi:phosphoribosylanthranilate isomerase